MRNFADRNPLVLFLYFLSVSGIAMFLSHPLLPLLSLLGGMALYMIRHRGGKLRVYLFMLLLFIGTSLVNPIFSHNGVTVLFFVGDNPVTWEAFFFGMVSACRIIAMLYWFRSFSEIMTGDRLIYIFGKLSPKLSLLFSMVLRYVPLFTQTARRIKESQTALGLYKEGSIPDSIWGGGRIFSVLVTWTLENGIVTADSMSARGYGSGHRTHYTKYRFYKDDGAFLTACIGCVLVVLAGIVCGALDYQYYPAMKAAPRSTLSILSFAAYGILCAAPVIIEGRSAIRWHYLQSKI